jgi:CTP:molybdopterin cytidylyltransferase MocA
LGDKPLVTAALAQRVVEAAHGAGADVCFPERSGVGGHPVYFSPRARRLIGDELHGDSLKSVRDAPGLRRLAVPIADEGAYFDVDDPGALQRLEE